MTYLSRKFPISFSAVRHWRYSWTSTCPSVLFAWSRRSLRVVVLSLNNSGITVITSFASSVDVRTDVLRISLLMTLRLQTFVSPANLMFCSCYFYFACSFLHLSVFFFHSWFFSSGIQLELLANHSEEIVLILLSASAIRLFVFAVCVPRVHEKILS